MKPSGTRSSLSIHEVVIAIVLTALCAAAITGMGVFVIMRDARTTPTDAATVQGLVNAVSLAVGAQTRPTPAYYPLDGAKLQTFSPIPALRVSCFWVDVEHDDWFVDVKAPTRSAGLSCLQLSQPDWETYVDIFPTR
jgi:hypothetical protein